MIDAAEFRRLVEQYDYYYAIMMSERPGSEQAQEAAWRTQESRIDLERFVLDHTPDFLALAEASEWRPIETAPRDGTVIWAANFTRAYAAAVSGLTDS